MKTEVFYSEEVLRFLATCQSLVEGPAKEARIKCEGPGHARKLRRHFYYIRDVMLSAEHKPLADRISFRLNGCQLILGVKPQWEPKLEGVQDESSSNG